MTRDRILHIIAGVLLAYLLVAYVAMPAIWRRYIKRHPLFDNVPNITHTKSGIPGDALNVALVGTEDQVLHIMLAARWYPADPLTLRSSLRIAADTVLRRPYDEAPVSNLYLFGRKEDLAFEKPVGDSPKKRHHVRFWKTDKTSDAGRPLWIGAATYDERVGLSKTTGQVTHVTAPDIDTERDFLFKDLKETRDLADVIVIDHFHTKLEGKNGGGDPWRTDGDLYLGIIKQ